MNAKSASILLLTILILFPVSGHAEKDRLAVMDFRADGLSQCNALRISELIRTEIINTGVYTVIERNQMDMVLKEQGIQQTGALSDEYALKVGELLSAQKILIGTAMRLGKSIIISGRIVDIEKGIAEFGAQQSAADEDELLEATTLFCKKLTGKSSHTTKIASKKQYIKTTQPARSNEKPAQSVTKKPAGPKSGKVGCMVNPNKKVYAPYEEIILEFSNFPGNRYDWISIAQPGSENTSYHTYSYTGEDMKTGAINLRGIEAGKYEIRYYYDWENGKYDYHVLGNLTVADK
ncbi:MAG: CsgG/HfaB family protein [Desulfobacterales bacterium]